MNNEFTDLEYKLLNEHHAKYEDFTRLLLGISATSLALLAALGETPPPSGNAEALAAKLAWLLFLVSTLAGVLVQYRAVMRPIDDLVLARALMTDRARCAPGDQTPLVLKRTPSWLEQHAFQLQSLSFVMAFCALSISALYR